MTPDAAAYRACLLELCKEAGVRDWLRSLREIVAGTPIKSGVLDPATGKEILISARRPLQDIGESFMESGALLKNKPSVAGVHGLPEAPSGFLRSVGAGLETMGKSYTPGEVGYNPIGYPAGRFVRGMVEHGGKEIAEAGYPRLGKAVSSLRVPASVLTEAGMGAAPAIGISPAAAGIIFGKSTGVTSGQEAIRAIRSRRAAKKALKVGGEKVTTASIYGHWGLNPA